MKKVMVISSAGVMDIAAITLMGLSSKRGDTEKIGMFGTGLKYSLSKLLRDRIKFRVWNGSEELEITTRCGTFRGQLYEQVVVNGEATSITTDMGPQWETWWVVRELLSNARDEMAHEFYVCAEDEVEFKDGWTTFVLDYEVFENVWLAREKFFVTDREPKWEGGGLKLLTRAVQGGTRIYKNGVLVHETAEDDVFDYDLASVELNEMREPRYATLLSVEVTRILFKKLTDKAIIGAWIKGHDQFHRYDKATFTGDIHDWELSTMHLSESWKLSIDELGMPTGSKAELSSDLPTGTVIVSGSLGHLIQADEERNRPIVLMDPDKQQRADIEMALQKMYTFGVVIKHQIKVAVMSPHTIAFAMDGRIVLSDKAFATQHMLISTLLEEAAHINSGERDATLGFQQAILDWWAHSILS